MAVTRKRLQRECKTATLTKKKAPRRRSSRKKKDESSKPQPIIQEEDTTIDSINEDSVSLNSSPIKHINRASNNSTPTKQLLSSSPSKKKKSVAFSDDLISEIPSTPDGSQNSGRSILKACNLNLYTGLVDPNNTSLWEKDKQEEKQSYGPKNPNFWLQGTIVQIPPNSSDIYYLIEGCIMVLGEESFDKRFEVYATLNSIYKTNTASNVVSLFCSFFGNSLAVSPSKRGKRSPSSKRATMPVKDQPEKQYVVLLTHQIVKDIESTENMIYDRELNKENKSIFKSDPFRIRIINQALKLLSYFMLDQELNKLIPLETIDWAYRRACTVLTNTKVSKAVLSSYLVIIKDCKLGAKRRKLLFDNGDLPEKMLFSLINMTRFPSSSLISEQFICFKNFVNLFPNIMAKNIHHWFGMLLLNICEIGSPFYLKCLAIGVHCLLEVTKAFLNNRTVMIYVRRFLSSPVPLDTKSMASSDSIELDSEVISSQETKVVDAVLTKLRELIRESQFKAAMDIWVALTVLIGNAGSSFDKWEHLNKWLQITKHCFNSQDPDARILALSCWKAVCFNLCRNDAEDIRNALDPILISQSTKDKQSLINSVMKPKVKLFTYLFHSFNAAEMEDEIIDTMHNLFVAILYSVVNPIVIKQRTKYLHILWDKVFQFVFVNFYFKKGSSNTRMNQLGLKVLLRLLKPASPINEKNYNEIRCLSNEPVLVTEINSLPSRWIHDKFDRIMQNMILVFQLDNLSVEDKVGFFAAFLASIKSVTRSESSISATTYDIIDNIPIVLNQLFKKNTLSHDLIIKLIVNLHDTFTSSLLLRRANENDANDTSYNLYLPILENCCKTVSKEETLEVFDLILQSLSQKKVLMFIADYLKLGSSINELNNVFIELLNKRNTDSSKQEMILYGEICKYLDSGFDIFVKRIIQSIVVMSDAEAMRNSFAYLNIESWNISIIIFFLVLVKNAPNKHVHQFTIELLRKLLKANFIPMLEFLALQDFDVELFPLLDQVFLTALEFVGEPLFKVCLILKDYLIKKIKQSDNYLLIDKLLMGCYADLGIDVGLLVEHGCSKFPEFNATLEDRGMCLFNGKIVNKSDLELLQNTQESIGSIDDDLVQDCQKPHDSQLLEESVETLDLIATSDSVNGHGTQIIDGVEEEQMEQKEQREQGEQDDSLNIKELPGNGIVVDTKEIGEEEKPTNNIQDVRSDIELAKVELIKDIAEEKAANVGEVTTIADITLEHDTENNSNKESPSDDHNNESSSDADEAYPSMIRRAFDLTQVPRPTLSPMEISPTRETQESILLDDSIKIKSPHISKQDDMKQDLVVAANKKRLLEELADHMNSPKRNKVDELELILQHAQNTRSDDSSLKKQVLVEVKIQQEEEPDKKPEKSDLLFESQESKTNGCKHSNQNINDDETTDKSAESVQIESLGGVLVNKANEEVSSVPDVVNHVQAAQADQFLATKENKGQLLPIKPIPIASIIDHCQQPLPVPVPVPEKNVHYSPIQLTDMLEDLSNDEISSMTSEERYSMETKLLNLMVRIRGLT